MRIFIDDLADLARAQRHSSIEQAASISIPSRRAMTQGSINHPFNNGNGRWSRLLAEIHLKSVGFAADNVAGENINTDESAARKVIRSPP